MTYKLPTSSFIFFSSPIASSLCSFVMDRNNKRKVWSGGEANTLDLVATCFNIDRKDSTAADEPSDEDMNFAKRWLCPDRDRGAADIRELLLANGFGEVGDADGPQLPLPRDC